MTENPPNKQSWRPISRRRVSRRSNSLRLMKDTSSIITIFTLLQLSIIFFRRGPAFFLQQARFLANSDSVKLRCCRTCVCCVQICTFHPRDVCILAELVTFFPEWVTCHTKYCTKSYFGYPYFWVTKTTI